jgi:hypothetical protein
MSDKRQKNQMLLAFVEEWRGEAPNGLGEGTESLAAKRGTESPAISEQLMEEVCERGKLQAGIGTSQGQQRERRRGRDDRPAVAGVPETALASHPGTVVEWNL